MTVAANIVKFKRSNTTGNAPATTVLQEGEIALNTYDGKLFFKTTQNSGTSYNLVTLTENSLIKGSYSVTLNSDGTVSFPNYKFPVADGTSGEYLVTDGAGNLTWTAASGAGTVTAVSVVNANGFSGTVATANTTPAITIQTTVTGLLKGNGTSVSAATSGTDYLAPGSLSITTLSAGTESLSYSNGVFTFTPADLSSYVTSSSLSSTLSNYVTASGLSTTLMAYATETYVTSQGYITNSVTALTSLTSIGASNTTTTANGDFTVTGNLTVNGTTTTVNSTTVNVKDKYIVLGNVATPTDATASGGGIELLGTTNKTFYWTTTNSAWESSENIDLPTGKSYMINGVDILTDLIKLTSLSVGTPNSPSGTGSISYSNTTGVFTYTPPDLSSYVTSTSLSSTLSNYVTSTSLSSTLNNYVTSATLSGYHFISLTSLSTGTPNSPSGTGSISYSNTTGVFTYTPPDLSSYVTSTSLSSTLSSYVTSSTLNSYNYITLASLSMDTPGAASGSGSVTYSNTTGKFKYTPPDLSSYITASVTALNSLTSFGSTGVDTTANGNLIVSGNLTVNGTTTTVNSTTVNVEDKLIVLGNVATPTDSTASGGGIELLGTTNKTFEWTTTNSAWESSENIDLASGKAYMINGVNVLTGTTLGSSVTSSSLTSVGTLTNLTVTNTITGSISGNANTATTLQTARKINNVSFDGSQDITVTADAGTLTGTTLNSTVVNSSLTSVGTLTNLTVTNTITGSITGNAGTVTNGVYTTGSYANPSWITSLAYSKLTGAPTNVSSFTNDAGYVTSSTLNSDLSNITSLNNNGYSLSLASNGTVTAPGDILVNNISVSESLIKALFLYQDGDLSIYTGTIRWYASQPATVTKIVARLARASDTGVTVQVRKNGTVVETINIPGNSLKTTLTTGLFTMAVDDYLTVDTTAVGSANNTGSGLSVQFSYYYS